MFERLKMILEKNSYQEIIYKRCSAEWPLNSVLSLDYILIHEGLHLFRLTFFEFLFPNWHKKVPIWTLNKIFDLSWIFPFLTFYWNSYLKVRCSWIYFERQNIFSFHKLWASIICQALSWKSWTLYLISGC